MPTTRPTDPDCPFCDLVARARGAPEMFRTDAVVTFFPPEPATLGHTLLIARAHVRDIWEVGEDTAAELGRQTVILAEAVKRTLNTNGHNVIQSNGAAATQTVMHVHVHIVPRWEGDAIGRIWPPEINCSEDAKDDAWEALRREFQDSGHQERPQQRHQTDQPKRSIEAKNGLRENTLSRVNRPA